MLKRLVLAGMFAAGLVAAQDDISGGGMGGGRGGGGRGGDSGMGGGAPMARRATKAELFVDKLKLNREQQEEAQKILSAAMERVGEIRVEMDNRRLKIAEAIMNGKSADEVTKLTTEFGDTSAQFTKLEADAFGKIWATLKPNQQSKADQAFELLAGIFADAGRPRVGMGRGRGAGR